MTQFMYCIPGAKNSGKLKIKDLFKEHGIEYAYKEGAKYQITPVNNTPAEQSGIIVQADGEFGTCKYNPESQQWARIDGTDCYVGMWNGDKITPSDLKRDADEFIEGYIITLRDKNEWTIPVGRFNLDNGNTGCLKHSLAVDANGKLIKGTMPARHQKLSDIAEDLMDKVVNNTEQTELETTYGENYPFDILSGNYRIWKSEVALLKLWFFEDDYEKNIILFFIDAPGFMELKKKELEGSNTNAGKKD